ncbi:hypothetical protein SAY87_018610 [Trapa incisa]|uniref:RING-type domain-containing protein n=1 Tax=Trapa incisa TaxID=236973 RepID=A0AAN7Q1A3_9MYRT|nr:hypothetical protein SAY87_018610 [Trapa incisa]
MAGTFKLEARISSREDEEEDYDLILFNILYENTTQVLEMDESEEDVNVEYENSVEVNTSRYFNRNQLSDFDSMESAFNSLMDPIIPPNLMKATCEELANTAQLINNRLSDLDDEQQYVVDITINMALKFEGENSNSLDNYFENLLIEKMCDNGCKKVYNPYTSQSWLLIPHNEMEDDDTCPICCQEFISDNDSPIVMIQRSHKYHFKCIFRWLRQNDGCPLCRSEIAYGYDIIIIYRPMIYDDYSD